MGADLGGADASAMPVTPALQEIVNPSSMSVSALSDRFDCLVELCIDAFLKVRL